MAAWWGIWHRIKGVWQAQRFWAIQRTFLPISNFPPELPNGIKGVKWEEEFRWGGTGVKV